jgi:hypothetical protein
MALSDAERARRYRERHKDGAPSVRYRRPADRRGKPRQWDDAVQTLLDLLDGYQAWRDNLLSLGTQSEVFSAVFDHGI